MDTGMGGVTHVNRAWLELFSQVQTLKLPTDFPRTTEEVSPGGALSIVSVPVEFGWTKRLPVPSDLLVSRTNQQLIADALTSFAVVLIRLTCEESFLIGTNLPNSLFAHVEVDTSNPKQQLFGNLQKRISETLQENFDSHGMVVETPMSPNNLKEILSSTLSTLGENAAQMIQVSFGHSNSADQSGVETSLLPLFEVYKGVDFHLQFNTQDHTLQLYYQKRLFLEERMQELLEQMVLVWAQSTSFPEKSLYDFNLISLASRKYLPDPQVTLPATWNGSVISYLEKNAAQVPDKLAVVDKNESLTYKVLNSLSNQLARQLIQLGIKKGETVAIFGHRSVATVWAIAGVLKAGGSYTMIDPSYPAQRIIDCLMVAGPVGAIFISAIGKLPTKVDKFMNDHSVGSPNPVKFVHHLKKPFEVLQNSSLSSIDDSNLDQIQLTPDDIAVVTFTSGSTGIPKGVLGRHGPLTQYYPWMKQKFGFTEEERFSMQSGIAHDPLQRDVFTPWFLGATLFVPDPEDIINPGRLSQWFKEKKITITHLTPAMGQLLTSGESSQRGKGLLLDDLRYAFFVGDVLNKKFVRGLCRIAPNIHVINIYGSTETQRSVSYFVVPRPNFESNEAGPFERLKDILPVGKGMEGLQALVLSRFTTENKYQAAGLGELGEIYMRSSHLSLGYRGKPEETAEKFIYNPFIPREEAVKNGDRMYKTGDLGRYLTTGDVECMGRADDQVKIRGFRVELGEINTALASHNFVKECVTIVRNDLFPNTDEKRIVSYLIFDSTNLAVQKLDERQQAEKKVNKGEQLSQYGSLVKELREYLRSKLPEYMIPSAFVVLAKLPLTPNGKIKKEALPKPDPSCYFGDEDFIAPRNPLEFLLAEIWAEVLGVQKVGIHDNFFDLGGHSISATSLTLKVREAVSHANKLPVEALYNAPTIAAMAIAIEQLKSGALGGSHKPAATNLLPDTYLDSSIIPEDVEWANKYNPQWANPKTILITGCTGFLGAFLLCDLLKETNAKIFCLVRAPTTTEGFERIKNSLVSHELVWNPKAPDNPLYPVVMSEFEAFLQSRVVAIAGDLSKPLLGLSEETFHELEAEVDVIIHSGAVVHWMYPYEKLKAANVLGTQEIIRLACGGKLKPIHHISTTSVFDSDQYSHLSDVFESSDLPYHEDLRGGYPQSKYVAEKLVMNARKLGIPSCIYRPGYVTGHSRTGISNPDDFLCRMMKGCILLGSYPDLARTKLDMTPVDYISKAIVYLMTKDYSITKHKAYHMVNPHEFFFNELFETAVILGYNLKKVPFDTWKGLLMKMVTQEQAPEKLESNPLYPLMTYFSDDFGTRMRTKRPWYDNTHMLEGMKDSQIECPPVIKLIGTYYRFLCQCGFLEPPQVPSDLAVSLGFQALSPRSPLLDNMIGSDYESGTDDEGSAKTKEKENSGEKKKYKDLMRKNR